MTQKKQVLLGLLLLAGTCALFSQAKPEQQTLRYYDSSRNRELLTEVWIPSAPATKAFPLILFSHGTGGNRLACRWFCEGLAERGFMVAAVDHFGNTFTNPIPRQFVTVWERPQDLSFVLTQILKEKSLADKIDPQTIYAAGFSIGGYTSLALAGARIDWDHITRYFRTPEGAKEVNIPEMPGLIDLFEDKSVVDAFRNAPDLKDGRIRAVFVMAPAAGQGFPSRRQLRDVTIPVFIVGAEADSIAPLKTNALHYRKLMPKAKWFLIKGDAGHYVFLNEGNEEMKKAAPVFFRDADGVDRRRIHDLVVEKAERFFREN